MQQRASSFSTLVLLTIRELRLERGVHQAFVAQAVGKTPSAWAKIEGGQSPLSMDAFFAVCGALQLQPSYVMTLVERLVHIFNNHGWFFQSNDLGDEDELLPLVQSYFASSGYDALKNDPVHRVSLMVVGSVFGPGALPTIVRYCCEQSTKEWIDNGAKFSTSPAPLNMATTASAGTLL